jgi:DNA-directed RNA polymerase subunit omega
MNEARATLMEPPIEQLLDKVDSKFTLVTLAAKRGREINLYYNQLGEGLGAVVPPQVTTTSRKPLSIAMEEIAAGKIVFVQKTDEEIAAEQAAAAEKARAEAAAAADAAAAAAAQIREAERERAEREQAEAESKANGNDTIA